MEIQEIKQKIKEYFVDIKEDKFTKVKSINCKHKLKWKGSELDNKFMFVKDSASHSLSMSLAYRHKDDIDSVFFTFTYANMDGGYPEMSNLKLYLILDEDKTIELSDVSDVNHASKSDKIGENYVNIYVETAQLTVNLSDFIAIANAKKIEYSIRFGHGSLENIFYDNQLTMIKGFYNSTFDDDFDIEYLLEFVNEGKEINQDDKLLEKIIYHIFLNEGKLSAAKKYREATNKDLNEALKYISKFEDKAKNELALKYHNPIEIFFFVENSFSIWFDDNIKSIERINNDTTGFWNKDIISQIDFNELKVGIRTNSGDLFPSLLIFPEALIYIKSNIIFQIYYNKFTSIDSKKSGLLGLGGSSILIEANNSTHRIDMNCSIGLAIIIVDFLKKQMIENKSKIESKSYLIEPNIANVTIEHFKNEEQLISELFMLNNIQKGLILNSEESLNRINNGLYKWRNKYTFEGEILFGINALPFNKAVSNIFTSMGIYQMASGAKAKFILYKSNPRFYFKAGSLFAPNNLIEKDSNITIELVSISPNNEKGQTIINSILNYVNYKYLN